MVEWFKATVLKTVGGEEPSVGSNPTTAATRPCEMIYHGWFTDYGTEKRMDIRVNTLECDGTPSTKSNRASKR